MNWNGNQYLSNCILKIAFKIVQDYEMFENFILNFIQASIEMKKYM